MVPPPQYHDTANSQPILAVRPGRPLLLSQRSNSTLSGSNPEPYIVAPQEPPKSACGADAHSLSRSAGAAQVTDEDFPSSRATPAAGLQSLPLPHRTSLPTLDTVSGSEVVDLDTGDDSTAIEHYTIETKQPAKLTTPEIQHPYSSDPAYKALASSKSSSPAQRATSTSFQQSKSVFEYSPPSSSAERPAIYAGRGPSVSSSFKRFWRKGQSVRSGARLPSRRNLSKSPSDLSSSKTSDSAREYHLKGRESVTSSTLLKNVKALNSTSPLFSADKGRKSESRSPYTQHRPAPSPSAHLESDDQRLQSSDLSYFSDNTHQAIGASQYGSLSTSRPPSVRSYAISDSVEASSQHGGSVWTASHTSLGSSRAPINQQGIEDTSHEPDYEQNSAEVSVVGDNSWRQIAALSISSKTDGQIGSDLSPLNPLPAQSQRPPRQPLGRISGLCTSEFSQVQPHSATQRNSDSVEMTTSGKGNSWRSRFGGKKSGGGESAPSSASATTYRNNGDRDGNTDFPNASAGRRGDGQRNRNVTAQFIAPQQQPNDVAKPSSTLSRLDVQSSDGLVLQASQNPSGSRLDEYKRTTQTDVAASSNVSITLERITGEFGFSSSTKYVSTYDTLSPNSTQHSGNRSYPGSEAGQQDDASCPVCLELLSFRLAGEKKHVVPVCGHALHHACFSAVYGSPESVLASQSPANGYKSSPPGMCGVCRRLIVLDEEDKHLSRVNKVAGMMGVETTTDVGYEREGSEADMLAHDDSLDAGSMSARLREKSPSHSNNAHSANGGKPLTKTTNADRRGIGRQQIPDRSMVLPEIKIRPEYDTVYLKNHPGARMNNGDSDVKNALKNVVCVISINIPSRRPSPLCVPNDEESTAKDEQAQPRQVARSPRSPGTTTTPKKEEYETDSDDFEADSAAAAVTNGVSYPRDSHFEVGITSPNSVSPEHRRGCETTSFQQSTTTEDESSPVANTGDDDDEGFSFGATPKGFFLSAAKAAEKAQDHEHVIDDLRDRIVDWKGHTIERFGLLMLHEHLGVRQDSVVRDFFVYLFQEALLCVNEERQKEKSFTRLISADRSQGSDEHTLSGSGSSTRKSKTPLKLKGRIWLRHIRHCTEAEIDGKPCVSIKLDDESLDQFVLCFKDATLRGIWCAQLSKRLLEIQSAKKHRLNGKPSQRRVDAREGVESTGRDATLPAQASHLDRSKQELIRMHADGKPRTIGPARPPHRSMRIPRSSSDSFARKVDCLNDDVSSDGRGRELFQAHDHNTVSRPSATNDFATHLGCLPRHQQWSASGGLDPSAPVPQMKEHTAIDLVIIVSVPSASSTSRPGLPKSTLSSSAALKLRLIRSTLDFVIANMGPRDRIALVSYQVGENGVVRRTALLNSAKSGSRAKLDQFISSTGQTWEDSDDDPFREDVDELGGRSDRTDTVSAVNVGFDIVLQRKSKNPVTAMLLINDTTDAPKRAQMDLIMARAEAADVPVHCFGFGKGHDPSSLWLVSNHTRGSYTFVKEWYQLRECVAGCIGSLMSVALTNVRLHISIPSDNHFRVRKVSGCTGTVISSSGKDVDLELGEMRFGEGRELFVELELDVASHMSQLEAQQKEMQMSALAQQYEKGSATDDFMQRLGLQGLGLSTTEGFGTGLGHRRACSNRQRGFVDDRVDEQWGDALRKSDAESDDEVDAARRTTIGYVEEVAVMEVQCGCRDPAIGAFISRLPDAGMLTVEVDATSRDPTVSGNATSPGLATSMADPVVTRRRLEILVSDMITRCLLLVSRRNHAQALTLLLETRRIVDTVLQSMSPMKSPIAAYAGDPLPAANGASDSQRYESRRASHSVGPSTDWSAPFSATKMQYARPSKAQKQREKLHKQAVVSLTAILEDLDVLLDGLETGKTIAFERSERNFGAQQAMVLRDQKAWTSRTDTEWQFFNRIDNGAVFAALAAHSAAEFSR